MSVNILETYRGFASKTICSTQKRDWHDILTKLGDYDKVTGNLYTTRAFGRALANIDAAEQEVDRSTWELIALEVFGRWARTSTGYEPVSDIRNAPGTRKEVNLKTLRSALSKTGITGAKLYALNVWVTNFLVGAAQIIDLTGPENVGRTDTVSLELMSADMIIKEAKIYYYTCAYSTEAYQAGRALNDAIYQRKKTYDPMTIATWMDEAWRRSNRLVNKQLSQFISDMTEFQRAVRYLIISCPDQPDTFTSPTLADQVLELSNFIPYDDNEMRQLPVAVPKAKQVERFLTELKMLVSAASTKMAFVETRALRKRFKVEEFTFADKDAAIKVFSTNLDGSWNAQVGYTKDVGTTPSGNQVVNWVPQDMLSEEVSAYLRAVISIGRRLKYVWALARYEDSLGLREVKAVAITSKHPSYERMKWAVALDACTALYQHQTSNSFWVYGVDSVLFSKYMSQNLAFSPVFPTTDDVDTVLAICVGGDAPEPAYPRPNPFYKFDLNTDIIVTGSEYSRLALSKKGPVVNFTSKNLQDETEAYPLTFSEIFLHGEPTTNTVLKNAALQEEAAEMLAFLRTIPATVLPDVRDKLRSLMKEYCVLTRQAFKVIVCSRCFHMTMREMELDANDYKLIIAKACLALSNAILGILSPDIKTTFELLESSSFTNDAEYVEMLGV